MAISMLKIRRPLGRLIFNMGIAIPGKTVFLIETAPLQELITLQRQNEARQNRLYILGYKYIQKMKVNKRYILYP